MTALVPGLITSLRQVTLVQSAVPRLLSNRANRFYLHSAFSTSPPLRGLEEFFPPLTDNPADLVEESEKAGQLRLNIYCSCEVTIPTAGRPWKKNELRLKSNDELHKLW